MSEQTASFLDTPLARLLALAIAALLALLIWLNGAAEIKSLFTAQKGTKGQEMSTALPAANPNLEHCLKQRIGDVERMKKEGILSDHQYTAFRSRAESLCHSQNPN